MAILVVPILFAGCQTTGGAGKVENSWKWGMHRLPATAVREGGFTGLAEIRENPVGWHAEVARTTLKPDIKLPAVIYLHGCAGNTGGSMWAGKFGELGYAFFAPDSLARPRRSQCSGRNMPSRIAMRLEEMRYALAELAKADWIDRDRLILMGSSEGAHAASKYDGRDFAAVIIVAADCRFSGGTPNVPDDIPVLNMVGSLDDQGGGSGCTAWRPAAGSKKVDIKGAGHKLYGNRDARKVLESFLGACCS